MIDFSILPKEESAPVQKPGKIDFSALPKEPVTQKKGKIEFSALPKEQSIKPSIGRDFISATAYELAGGINGLTAGYVNLLPELEKNEFISGANVDKRIAATVGGIIGSVVPIGKISRVLSTLGKGKNIVTAGTKTISKVRPVLEHLARSGATGIIWGGIRNPGEDETRLTNALNDAAVFMAFTGAIATTGKALEAAGLGKWGAYQKFKKSIIDYAVSQGQTPAQAESGFEATKNALYNDLKQKGKMPQEAAGLSPKGMRQAAKDLLKEVEKQAKVEPEVTPKPEPVTPAESGGITVKTEPPAPGTPVFTPEFKAGVPEQGVIAPKQEAGQEIAPKEAGLPAKEVKPAETPKTSENALVEEAKKYPAAEDFINVQQGAEPMAAIPGEPISYLGSKGKTLEEANAVIIYDEKNNEPMGYKIELKDGLLLNNPKSDRIGGSPYFESYDEAEKYAQLKLTDIWNEAHKGEAVTLGKGIKTEEVKKEIPAEQRKLYQEYPSTPKRQAIYRVAERLENRLGINPKKSEELLLRHYAKYNIKQLNDSEVVGYTRILRDSISGKVAENELLNKAKKIGIIHKNKEGKEILNNYNRFIRNYFNKSPKDLTKDEMRQASALIGQVSINRKGIVTIPKKTVGLLVPENIHMLKTHQVGGGQYFIDYFSYLKRLDTKNIKENIGQLRELLRGAKKEETIPLMKLFEKMNPLKGNDLRIWDSVGIYKDLGKPLEEAGDLLRKENYEIDRLKKEWTKVAKETKDGDTIMFKASNSPIEQWKEQLTDNQIKVIEEWKRLAAEHAERHGIEKPIENYIHHKISDIFQVYIKEKFPFPEELAGIIEFIIPEKMYAPFLKERLGFPFIKESFVDSTIAYLRMSNRVLAYKDPLKIVAEKLKVYRKSNPKLVKYVKGFIDTNIFNRDIDFDRNMASTLNIVAKVFGNRKIEIPEDLKKQAGSMGIELPGHFEEQRIIITPKSIKRFIGVAKLSNYLSVIAMNTSTTVTNLTQQFMNLFIRPGDGAISNSARLAKSNIYAISKLFSKKAWKLMEDKGIIEKMDRMSDTDKDVQNLFNQLANVGLLNMKVTEFINRVATSKYGAETIKKLAKKGQISAYELDRIIASDPEFQKEADFLDKSLSDAVNYLYGADYTPPVFRSVAGRIMYHLNSFGLKYLTTLSQWAGNINVGNQLKELNKIYKNATGTEEDYVKFIDGLPPQEAKNLIAYLIFMAGVGGIFYKDIWRFTTKGVGFAINNPITQQVLAIISGNVPEAVKVVFNNNLWFKAAYKRIRRISKQGITGAVGPEEKAKEERGEDEIYTGEIDASEIEYGDTE